MLNVNNVLIVRTVAEGGFKMIFSNHDATYLDCGFGGWVGHIDISDDCDDFDSDYNCSQ